MEKNVTFNHILTIMGLIIIPLFIWGVNVERRFERVIDNSEEIYNLKINSVEAFKSINNNHLEVMQQLHNIELGLKDKANR